MTKSNNIPSIKPPTVGFTGSQDGMTTEQMEMVRQLLIKLQPSETHHGDCFGADAVFHEICKDMNLYIVSHPGMDARGKSLKRAYKDADKVMPTLPYLQRNTRIVDECKVLIATPRTYVEELRSGTWSTIRKAKQRRRTIFIVYPDGSVDA